ncbi:MAG: carbon-nitrogen hydrolase family protein [Chloroflexota bacterium]|nr:carbon-nitrogen hydrolase family protein [Chloroflexota bacterium]
MGNYPKLKVAAVQAAPVFLDKKATIQKACRLIFEATQNGAKLIVFPEVFIPAYPCWLPEGGHGLSGPWVYWWRELLDNSVEVPSADTDILCQAAKAGGVYVVMGLNERDRLSQGTIYNTSLIIGKEGRIIGHHRKLVPTSHERMFWGRGDGSGLVVCDTEWGRLSSLICAEHLMVLPKYALLSKGEQVHCALWPGWPGGRGGGIKPTIDVASRCYALEGQVWVIVASGYMTADMVPDSFLYKKSVTWNSFGGSGIISPRGNYVAGPVYDEETIVYGDIDLGEIPLAKAAVDTIGHYARWDVVNLNLSDEQYRPYSPKGKGSGAEPHYRELRASLAELLARLRERPDPDLVSAAEEVLAKLDTLEGITSPSRP